MGLLVCKDCKKEFSTDAKKCPHCGANKPRTKSEGVALFVFLVFFLVLVAGLVGGGGKDKQPSAASGTGTQTSKEDSMCTNRRLAYAVVRDYVEERNLNAKVADIDKALFYPMNDCKIYVISYAKVTNKAGYIEKDDFAFVVSRVPVEGGGGVFQVDLAETLKYNNMLEKMSKALKM